MHAWDDKNLDVTKAIDEITECLCVFSGLLHQPLLTRVRRFHPDFYDGKSKVQSTMLGYMHEWVEEFGHKKKSVLRRLTKESVREHKNVLRQGETGPSQALVNPLGLPTLKDLRVKLPPRGARSDVVGTHEGKPVYFSPEMYGKGGDSSPATKGSPYASPYAPSSAGSETSYQDQQRYMWTPGVSHDGEGSIPEPTEDSYSAERSNSLPAAPNVYSPPPGPPQSTEDFYSARPNPRQTVAEGHASPQWGPSKAARDFYSSPGPASLEMGSPQRPYSRGMDLYAQELHQGSQPSYNPYLPHTPQISPEAASFYASPQPASRPGKEDQADPMAELTASLRKF